jgi:hypothetical protein
MSSFTPVMTKIINKKLIILEVAIFGLIVILDALGVLPITQTVGDIQNRALPAGHRMD